jgi:hypothetical protein
MRRKFHFVRIKLRFPSSPSWFGKTFLNSTSSEEVFLQPRNCFSASHTLLVVYLECKCMIYHFITTFHDSAAEVASGEGEEEWKTTRENNTAKYLRHSNFSVSRATDFRPSSGVKCVFQVFCFALSSIINSGGRNADHQRGRCSCYVMIVLLTFMGINETLKLRSLTIIPGNRILDGIAVASSCELRVKKLFAARREQALERVCLRRTVCG